MGWTSYQATHYGRNGKIDRRAECDSFFARSTGGSRYKVLKSAMKGSTYYAAIAKTAEPGPNGQPVPIPEDKQEVWAAVFLTRTNMKDRCFNFSYKDMDETMGPCEAQCPESILSLLTPIDSDWANEWRERCMANAARQKSPDALRNLPVGSVIRYKRDGGDEAELTKCGPAFQLKRPFWLNRDTGRYVPTKWLPDSYEIVSRGDGNRKEK